MVPTVISVSSEEVTYTPALASADVYLARVDIWGTEPDTLKTDYRLQCGSPSVNTDSNAAVTERTDLDDNPRQVDGTVDKGAYEVQ